MKHTFIMEQGKWNAIGHLFDEKEKEVAVAGRAKITHHKDKWINESLMKPMAGHGKEIQNNYEIVPLDKDANATTWKSDNPSLGALNGKFFLLPDVIVSVFESENGHYSGTELMKHVKKNKYMNIGVVLKDGKKMSSWAIELNRADS